MSDAEPRPSPRRPFTEPLEIVELDAIVGYSKPGRSRSHAAVAAFPSPAARAGSQGVDAVIDKDRASALLARELEAEHLIILTEVSAVYRSFGDQDQRDPRALSQ